MKSFPGFSRKTVTVAALFIIAILPLTALAVGCGGGNSPEGAVTKYFNAMQSGDWNTLKASVVPQKLTKDQEALAKQKFEQVKVKVQGLSLTTELNKSDKNKATVVITDGKITYTAPILGQEKTETRDFKSLQKEERVFNVVRVNDIWYVETALG
jgi:hypothetical protein